MKLEKGVFSRRELAGVPLASASKGEIVTKILESKNTKSNPRDIHLVNAYTIALAGQDELYLDILKRAWLNVPDGRPLQLLTSWSKVKLNQYRGPDLFIDVIRAGVDHKVRHFFLGGTASGLESLLRNLKIEVPGMIIAGFFSPEFGERTIENLKSQDETILNSNPDIVWVGLGTPKQDFEVARLAARINATVIAVGAAFDFHAGLKRQAPSWMGFLGLEWVYRLFQEPKRLWKRYLIGNFQFLIQLWSKRDKR